MGTISFCSFFLFTGGDDHCRKKPLLEKTWELRAANGMPLQEINLDERRCELPHFRALQKKVTIRPIHLWDNGCYEPIDSEEDSEEESEESVDDDADYY